MKEGKAAYRRARAAMHAWFRLWNRAAVEGIAHVPARGSLVVAANHVSYLDPFLLGETMEYGSFSPVDLLGLFSSPDGSLALYVTTGLANVPAGSYTGTITIFWDWDYCTSVSVTSACLERDTGSGSTNITLKLDVSSSCDVTSHDVLLGSTFTLGAAISAPLPIDLSCTKEHTYHLYVDGGDNYDGVFRNMVRDTVPISYRILTEDSVTPIGPSVANSQSDVGTGATQALQFIVETTPTDSYPPAGIYSDTVRVIVEY